MGSLRHCFPVSVPSLHPLKSPSAAAGGSWHEPFVCGPVLWLPKAAFCRSIREGDHPPMRGTAGVGSGSEGTGWRSHSRRQSRPLAATLSLLCAPGEHGKPLISSLPLLCLAHSRVMERLSRCLWYDALGHCMHGGGAGEGEENKSSLMSSQWKEGQEKWDWRREIRRDLLGHAVHYWDR